MPALTAVYLDLHCPYSLRAWRWLVALGSAHGPGPASDHAPGPAVDARPYWRGVGGPRVQPWDAEGRSWTLDVLALGELARERGRRAHHDYVGIALRAVHTEKLDVGTPGGLEALASRASLDLTAFTAERERWRAEVGLHHREAEDDFGVFETPTLVFDDDRAVLVRLVDDVRRPSAARALLDDVVDLTGRFIPDLRRTA